MKLFNDKNELIMDTNATVSKAKEAVAKGANALKSHLGKGLCVVGGIALARGISLTGYKINLFK